MENYILEYHAAISKGKPRAGKWVKAVYKMLAGGLKRGDYLYDARKAGKAIRFIKSYCRHAEGRDDLIKLELWQKAFVAAIFGIVDKDGTRVFREALLVVGRKNGKTLLGSAIIAYMAYVDGEYGAQICCLAPKLEQAYFAFDKFYHMIRKDPELAGAARKRRSDIFLEAFNTVIKPLAFSAKKSEGFNPHMVLNDEIASWRGDAGLKQYEAMDTALGARRQPLILSISTAGYENDGIYDQLIGRATAILKGNSREKRFLPVLYMIDDPDRWKDLRELEKANPNLGVSVPGDFFREAVAVAEQSAGKKAGFLVRYCNVKQNSSVAWLDYPLIDACGADLSLDDFAGCYCVGGIDLSQTTDLTAACVLIERGGVLHAFARFFMPAGRLERATAEDGVPYPLFIQSGALALSGDNHVDYRDVYDWFVWLREELGIYTLKIGYDRYSAQYLIDDLKAYGFHTDDVWQGENLAPVIREFEGILRDGQFRICANNLLKAHFLNVALKHNLETRKFRPVKIHQRARIDGFVAAIDALTVRQKYFAEICELLKNAG